MPWRRWLGWTAMESSWAGFWAPSRRIVAQAKARTAGSPGGGVDSGESGAEKGGVRRVGREVRNVGGTRPVRGFGGCGSDGEDRIEVGGLHSSDREGHERGAGFGRGGALGAEKISASERRM